MILLGSQGLLKEVKRNFVICDWCGCFPFKWARSLDQMEAKTKGKLLLYSVRLWMALLYFVISLFQVIRTLSKASLVVVTHNVMFISAAIWAFSFHIVNRIEVQNIVNLFNCMIEYEKSLKIGDTSILNSKLKNADLLVQGMIRILTGTGIWMPILYHLDILRNPCFPLYLGYWASDSCDETRLGVAVQSPSWSVKEMGTRVSISVVSYFNWSFLISGCCFMEALEIILQVHCLRTYIWIYGQQLMQIFGIDICTRKLTMKYRQLQLISIQYRMNYSRYMIGIVIPCIMAIEIFCLYNTISLFSGTNMRGSFGYNNLLYMWCGMVCVTLVIFVFGMLADVHNMSKLVHRQAIEKVVLVKNKWFIRWWKSCPILKIYFGGSNFLDRLTPLTIENFVIIQTVSLLLLKVK